MMKSFFQFSMLLVFSAKCSEARLGDTRGQLSKKLEDIRQVAASKVKESTHYYPYAVDEDDLHDGVEAHLRRMQSAPQDSLAFEQ